MGIASRLNLGFIILFFCLFCDSCSSFVRSYNKNLILKDVATELRSMKDEVSELRNEIKKQDIEVVDYNGN